jgi:hypothetical protein
MKWRRINGEFLGPNASNFFGLGSDVEVRW